MIANGAEDDGAIIRLEKWRQVDECARKRGNVPRCLQSVLIVSELVNDELASVRRRIQRKENVLLSTVSKYGG